MTNHKPKLNKDEKEAIHELTEALGELIFSEDLDEFFDKFKIIQEDRRNLVRVEALKDMLTLMEIMVH